MPELLRADGRLVRLSTLMQVADLEALNGRLTGSGGAEIDFSRGEVVAARLGALRGVPAVYECFLLPQETLVLEARDAAPAAPIAPLLTLIIEGSRLVDEWARLTELPLAVRTEVPADLDPEVGRVARRLDGRRRLETLVDLYGVARSRLVDPLLTLIERGVLVWEARAPETPVVAQVAPAPAPAPAPAASPDGFDDLMGRARGAVRAGRYDLARPLLEQALALRPQDATVRQNLRRLDQLQGGRFA